MSHVEVSYQSHGSRVAKAIGGAVIGLGMFLLSFIILFWNEGRAVQTEKSLTEGSKSVQTVSIDKVDPAKNGKLVHLSGLATTGETLIDEDFKVTAPNAIKLARDVEMYQWQEHKRDEKIKRANGSTVTITHYDYDKGWVSHRVDSSEFSESALHENPETMKYQSSTLTAQKVTVGAFTLSPELVAKIETSSALPVEKKVAELKALKAAIDEGGLYLGKDPKTPRVGDMRVHFKIVSPMQVSVVGQQAGSSFTGYQTSAGDALLLLKEGTLNAAQMFEAAQNDNVAMTWVLRFVGWLMMLIGLGLVFRPFAVIGDRFWFLGTLAGAGLALSAFAIASSLSILTIALSWVFFRPLMGIGLLLLGGGALTLYVRRAIQKRRAKTAAAAESGGAPQLQQAA
jgi:hypothetical protein